MIKPVLIRDHMVKDVFISRPDDNLKETIKTMASKKIGCTICIDKNRPVGILTERDILNRVVVPGIDTKEARLSDVMTKSLISMDSGKKVQEAVDVLDKKGIKKLPIIEKGQLRGIVTMTDLLRVLRKMEDYEAARLRKTIKELHLTKINLQSKIIELENRLSKLS